MLNIASQTGGWEIQTGDFAAFLEFSEGHLRLHALGDALPPTLASASGPFPQRLWFDQSVLLVTVGQSRTPIRWRLVGEDRAGRGLTLDLLAEDNSMTGRLNLVSPRDGVLVIDGSITATRPDLLVTEAVSVAVSVPDVQQQLYLYGAWGSECQQRYVSGDADLLLESRSGKTGFEYQPYLALIGDRSTSLIQLSSPGNWFLRSRPLNDHLTVTAGLNPWGLRHILDVNIPWSLPAATVVRVNGDLNAATQLLHQVQRDSRPNSRRSVPVQFNSWYPYPNRPTLEAMLELVPTAAKLGCEVFVLDGGWHTNVHSMPGESWEQRLGDWAPAPDLFPGGLSALSDAVRANGMDFGIWFEPEAVSSSSEIVSLGLPWLHAIPGAPDNLRHVLHLGIDEARRAIRDRIIEVLTETQASWIKWDFNTDLRQGGWPSGDTGGADPLVAHYEGLDLLQRELLNAFPDLFIEMCAGGGGRAEPRILRLAGTSWMSDQTQAVANLAIHLGSQLVRPPELCNDWLIEWPPHDTGAGLTPADSRGDLKFRTHVAMLGAFGISAPLSRWSDSELNEVRESVAWYRRHQQELLPRSTQYLLGSPPSIEGATDWSGAWYADQDGAGGTCLLFRLEGQPEIIANMPGLDPRGSYSVYGIPGQNVARMSGRQLEDGLLVRLGSRYSSAAITVVSED